MFRLFQRKVIVPVLCQPIQQRVQEDSSPLRIQNLRLTDLYHCQKKSRTWKTFKQIVSAEKSQILTTDDTTYGLIDAPTSFKPAKKYSDMSGLPALYTDPETKLRYATAEEYSRIRMLPNDIISGLLLLRKANNP